jgi:hypothetical protein
MRVFNLSVLVGGFKMPKQLVNVVSSHIKSKDTDSKKEEEPAKEEYPTEPLGFFETHHKLSDKVRDRISKETVSFRKGLGVLRKHVNIIANRAEERYKHNASLKSDGNIDSDDLSFNEEDLR